MAGGTSGGMGGQSAANGGAAAAVAAASAAANECIWLCQVSTWIMMVEQNLRKLESNDIVLLD